MSELLEKYDWRSIWYEPYMTGVIMPAFVLSWNFFGYKILYRDFDNKWKTTRITSYSVCISRDSGITAEELCEEYLICKLAGIKSDIRYKL
jgi:hypothetical protein